MLNIEIRSIVFQGHFDALPAVIERQQLIGAIATALYRSRIVVLIGPR